MSKIQTVLDVMNELMQLAIAKPESVDVSVRYIACVDGVEVQVVDKKYFNGPRNAGTWHAHKLMDETVYLDSSSALKQMRLMYNKVSNLVKGEVVA